MHKDDANKIQNFKNNQIITSGSLFFEKWLDDFKNPNLDEKLIKDELSLIKNENYILYLGSSKNIAKDETDILNEVLNNIEKLKYNCKIFIRPHPANNEPFKKVKNKKNIIYLKNSLPEAKKDIIFLYNLIKYSKGVFGINTSAMLEVMLLGKYCNTVLIDKYSKTQKNARHFKFIASMKSFKIHDCIYECVKFIMNNDQNLDDNEIISAKENIGLFNDLPSDKILKFLESDQ